MNTEQPMGDTPQTDAAQEWVMPAGNDSGPPHEQYVHADFARELERENAALREKVAALREYASILAGEWSWKRNSTPSNDREMAELDVAIGAARADNAKLRAKAETK